MIAQLLRCCDQLEIRCSDVTRIVKPQHFTSWLFPPQICVCFSHRLLCESEAGNSLDCALSFQLFHYPTHKLNNDALCFFCFLLSSSLIHMNLLFFSQGSRDQQEAEKCEWFFLFFFKFYIFYSFSDILQLAYRIP